MPQKPFSKLHVVSRGVGGAEITDHQLPAIVHKAEEPRQQFFEVLIREIVEESGRPDQVVTPFALEEEGVDMVEADSVQKIGVELFGVGNGLGVEIDTVESGVCLWVALEEFQQIPGRAAADVEDVYAPPPAGLSDSKSASRNSLRLRTARGAAWAWK